MIVAHKQQQLHAKSKGNLSIIHQQSNIIWCFPWYVFPPQFTNRHQLRCHTCAHAFLSHAPHSLVHIQGWMGPGQWMQCFYTLSKKANVQVPTSFFLGKIAASNRLVTCTNWTQWFSESNILYPSFMTSSAIGSNTSFSLISAPVCSITILNFMRKAKISI